MDQVFLKSEMDKLTEKIIGCAYQVSNTLGSGFIEKVYENALAHQLQKLAYVFGSNIQSK